MVAEVPVWVENERGGVPKPLISLTSLYMESGLYDKAERLLRPWVRNPVDETDPVSINLLHSFAAVQFTRGKYSEAESLYRRVLKAAEITFGPQSQEVAYTLNNLSMLLVRTGRSKEVGPHLEQALAIWESTLAPDHPHVARALANLAAFYCSTGKHSTAEPLFRRALAIAESSLGPENRLVAKILSEYALLLRKTKRKDEAKVLETRSHAIRQSHAPEDLGRQTVDLRDLLTSRDDRRVDKR